MKRLVSASLVVGILAAVLAVGAPAPAHAAVPDFTPSSSNSKKFIISVLGSMLGPLTPNKWKRENIANQFQYNHSWEQFAVQTGIDPLDLTYLNAPSTPDEYKLLHTEQQLKGGKMGKEFAAPATKLAKLTKVVSGVGAVMLGGELGFMVGKQVSAAMGFDPEFGLCEPGYEDFGIISTITGTDCSSLYEFSPVYDVNGDVVEGISVGAACTSDGSRCQQLVGVVNGNWGAWTNTDIYKVVATPASVNAAGMQFRFGGEWVMMATTGVSNSSSGAGNASCRAVWGSSVDGNDCVTYMGRAMGLPDAVSLVDPLTRPDLVQEVGMADPDPERTISCAITGSDGNTYTSHSEPYRESGGSISPVECPQLPEGVSADSVTIGEMSPDGFKELMTEATTDAYQNWAENFPECATGACKLDLKKKTGGTVLPSCFDLQQECMDWFDQPNREELYQCTYGNDNVQLSECFVYSGVFKPERLAIGAPYSDPVTGEWSGGQSSPKAGQDAMADPVRDPNFSRDCWAGGWAEFNPVEWIMTPVKCALEWAFVPRASVVELEFAKVNTAWAGTPPGVVIGTVGAWDLDLDLDGCGGIPITWQDQTINFLDACGDSPLASMAASARPIVSTVLVVAGILAIITIVAGIIGFRGLGQNGSSS